MTIDPKKFYNPRRHTVPTLMEHDVEELAKKLHRVMNGPPDQKENNITRNLILALAGKHEDRHNQLTPFFRDLAVELGKLEHISQHESGRRPRVEAYRLKLVHYRKEYFSDRCVASLDPDTDAKNTMIAMRNAIDTSLEAICVFQKAHPQPSPDR